MIQYSVVPAAMNLGFTGAMPVGTLPQLAQLAPDKYRQPDLVVVSSAPPGHLALAGIAPMCTVNTGMKYQAISSSTMALNNIAYGGQTTYVQAADQHHQLKVEQRMMDKREYREEVHHDIMATMMQQQGDEDHLSALLAPAGTMQSGQQLVVVLHEPKEAAAIARAIKQENRPDRIINNVPTEFISIGEVGEGGTWQSIGGGVADYLSALPLPLHHLLKYSTPAPMPVAMEAKRDEAHTIVAVTQNTLPPISTVSPQMQAHSHHPVGGVLVQTASVMNQGVNTTHSIPPPKKKKKKKTQKEKKPRPKPGEIRLTTALDGSTLYCCPECHMAYPERGLLEQHLLGHTLERKFICDICNAALKRKDHLTRHKQSHNPERPHVCNVCCKAFKRKEQLTLHFVIHSGEKRHVCNECGKGFYRKDHLRKHTRSHIARRVKAEMSLQTESSTGSATTQT